MLRRIPSRTAFTTVELLVIFGITVLLVGLLFPALLRVRSAALKTRSMSHMKQIHLWMTLYSDDNNGFVLPSQFDYSNDPFPGYVRTVPEFQPGMSLALGEENQGTWTDILWTENELGFTAEFAAVQSTGEAAGFSYVYDSPDDKLYEFSGGDYNNILRSAASNSRNSPSQSEFLFDYGDDPVARPYGAGAHEKGYPGYFAVNDNFNARADSACALVIGTTTWINTGQLRIPEHVMYMVDSVAGEIIEPAPYAFYNIDPNAKGLDKSDKPIAQRPVSNEVDFRYNSTCLMMLMDGHISSIGPWDDLGDLQKNRRINITSIFSSTPGGP